MFTVQKANRQPSTLIVVATQNPKLPFNLTERSEPMKLRRPEKKPDKKLVKTIRLLEPRNWNLETMARSVQSHPVLTKTTKLA